MQSYQNIIKVYIWDTNRSESVSLGTLKQSETHTDDEWTFSYTPEFIKSDLFYFFDPCFNLIHHISEKPDNNSFFAPLIDSAPDLWGSDLIQKAVKLKIIAVDKYQHKSNITTDYVDYFQHSKSQSTLHNLLRITDPVRKGALRFKRSLTGPFLDQDTIKAIPGIDYLDVIEKGINLIENDHDSAESQHALKTLLSPAASLGGSKPKCSVRDQNDQLWIAKCPSIHDHLDRGLWEYLTWLLAKQAGIDVPDAGLEKGLNNQHIFLSKRFDRTNEHRIHFISANAAIRMMSQNKFPRRPGYLHLSEFLQFYGAESRSDLHQLWRRLIFNLSISNHDDHIKNHGFLLTNKGWRLSPAFDLNPASLPGKGNRPMSVIYNSDKRDIEAAFEIGKYMQLNKTEMKNISEEVYEALSSWNKKANQLGIKSDESEQMKRAFIYPDKFSQTKNKPSNSTSTSTSTSTSKRKSFFRNLKENKNQSDDDNDRI